MTRRRRRVRQITAPSPTLPRRTGGGRKAAGNVTDRVSKAWKFAEAAFSRILAAVNRRILLLITDLNLGGTPTVVRELAVRLNRVAGVKVSVASLSGDGVVSGQLREAGVEVHALGARGVFDFVGTVRKLIGLIDDERFDTVFSFLVHANAVAATAATIRPGVRYLQSIQTTQARPRWHWWVQRLAAMKAERIVMPSMSVAIAARQRSGIRSRKWEIIPNAVEISDFTSIRRRDDIEADRAFHIGFIGRLDPIKQVGDLIQAAGLMAGRATTAGVGIHVDVFGEGQERRALDSLVESLGLQNVVTLHGSVEHPAEALKRIDALVLPSKAEGFGLVLIEAMAAGVPVIATDVPGIRDVVTHEETGLLVPFGRSDALATAICRMRTDRTLREELIRRGREEVARRYTWERVLPEYQRVLVITGM